ncbi:sensor histidine kinase [Celeribacter sp. SCSIO 80788]|uniref:sensor histidine kinase n=1 Tax=Celeribacter sp. SCSIO 80788 TaxID=3117013 RepID=UPI003DA64D25
MTPRVKLISLVVIVTLVSVVSLSVVHYVSTRAREEQIALTQLDAMAQIYAESLNGTLSDMTEDAALLAKIPPVLGIVRASADVSGIDPEDGSSLMQWRNRLETIFSGLMVTRPHYYQLRFIGRDDNWREIVRVNRTLEGEQRIAVGDLQQKGAEPYLAPVKLHNVTFPYFSEVTLNREHGKVEGPAMIRIVHPVQNGVGDVFGAIVINADFESLLRQAAPKIVEGIRATAITSALDYMSFGPDASPPELVFHSDPDWQSRNFFNLLTQPDKRGQPLIVGDMAVYIHQVEAASVSQPFALYLVTEKSKSDLFAEVRRRLDKDVLLSLLLIALSFSLALVVGNHLTRPLSKLHQLVTSRSDASQPIEFFTSPDAEVVELAQAFSAMSNNLLRETLRVRAMFSAVGNAVIVIDKSGTVEEFNTAAEEIFGYSQDEIVGRNIGLLMPPDVAQDHHIHIEEFGKSSRQIGVDREIIGLCKDGSSVHLEISISAVNYPDSQHLIGLVRDITAKKAAEAQVRDLIEALERSNEELDQFAYVASHDLRAPLRVIDNASRWLEEDLEDHLTEDTRESMELLRNRVHRMEHLLDDLLEHSRIGRVASETDWIRGDWLMDGIADLLDLPKDFTLNISQAFSEIEVLRMPLQTVLLNLIGNAIKHHDLAMGRIDVDVFDRGDAYEFRVTDDGPGIPEKYHKKVFEMFQTLKPRDQVEASGMGLAMVRKHVDVVGGRIHLISDGGRGTTFQVLWPKTAYNAQEKRKYAS